MYIVALEIQVALFMFKMPKNDSTPFTSSDIANYTELVNQTLDDIPLMDLSSYPTVIHELKLLISGELTLSGVEDHLKTALEPLTEYLDSSDPTTYDNTWGFRSDKQRTYFIEHIVKTRIKEKVKELTEMNDLEKKSRIEEQASRRKSSAQYQERVRDKKPPTEGSAAHVLSVQQWLSERQFLVQEAHQRVLEASQRAANSIIESQRRAEEFQGGVAEAQRRVAEIQGRAEEFQGIAAEAQRRAAEFNMRAGELNRVSNFSTIFNLFRRVNEQVAQPALRRFQCSRR